MADITHSSKEADVGIITILPAEIDALFRSLNIDADAYDGIESPLRYWTTRIFSKRSERELHVVVSILPGDAGNVESAVVTANFLRDWHPRLMCLVGIAAGVHGRVRIGDVVVPNKIHDRTLKVFKNGAFHVRTATHQRSDALERMLKIYPLSGEYYRSQLSVAAAADLFQARQAANKKGLTTQEFDEVLGLHDGSLASDNVLIRDSLYFDGILRDGDEKCRGGEMEAAGFVRACLVENPDFPWVVVRGVSDFGDERKDDAFQLLAAKSACAALKTFVVESLNVSLLPDNPRSRQPMNTLELNLRHQIEKAFAAERWGEVCRLGSAISRPLWVSGHYQLRTEIGAMVEAAAAYSDSNALRARTLIDDLGWTNFKIGRVQEAEKHIQDGVRLAKEGGDFYSITKGLRHLASICRRRSDQEGAGRYLEEAMGYAAAIEDAVERHEIEGSLSVSRGKLHLATDSIADAVAAFELALHTFREHDDREREVKVYGLIGECKLRLGERKEAMVLFERGRQLARDLGRFDELAVNTRALINVLPNDESERRTSLWNEVYEYVVGNGLWEEARAWRLSAPDLTREETV